MKYFYRVYRFSAGCLTNTQIKNPAVVLIHKQTLIHGCWRVVAAKSQNSDSFCQLPSVSENLWIFLSSVSFSVTLKLPNLKLPKPIKPDNGHGRERSFCFFFGFQWLLICSSFPWCIFVAPFNWLFQRRELPWLIVLMKIYNSFNQGQEFLHGKPRQSSNSQLPPSPLRTPRCSREK